MKSLISVLLFLPLLTIAQSSTKKQSQNAKKGITWERGLSWEQIKQKAKVNGKYIFVDCYATWCGPCKRMDSTIFTEDTVIEFLNDHYINVKVQMDSTRVDNEVIKSWYDDARIIQQAYDINALPSYVFISPQDEMVEKLIGAFNSSEDFLMNCEAALDVNKQYFHLKDQLSAHTLSSSQLRYLVKKALERKDKPTAYEASDAFVSSLTDPFNKEDLPLIGQSINTSSRKGFQLFLKNREKINKAMQKDYADAVLFKILYNEMKEKYLNSVSQQVDWNKIEKLTNKIAPIVSSQVMLKLKITDAEDKKSWEQYGELLTGYYDKYNIKLSKFNMNQELWTVFEKCQKKRTLIKAAKWSKTTFDWKDNGVDDAVMIDTYANLLYKAGKVKKAIKWELVSHDKAIEQKNKYQEKISLELIEKMKKGVPTWPIE